LGEILEIKGNVLSTVCVLSSYLGLIREAEAPYSQKIELGEEDEPLHILYKLSGRITYQALLMLFRKIYAWISLDHPTIAETRCSCFALPKTGFTIYGSQKAKSII